MDSKFLKPYNSQETEGRIYEAWEESGLFNPDNLPGDRPTPYTIMMPPPNATGVLHMGHALGLTVEDVLIRFKRMQGFAALWLPGTDHAAIATQARVEKDIAKSEKKSRHDLGREELVRRIDEFVEGSRSTIRSQIRVMGSSCDWSREAFTFDEKRNFAVNTMFKRMYDAGLIYRGHRIVNWDPKGQTTISDDEIVYEERKDKFYYLKYGPFVIGTARPETKFGDKYVVMHPDDARYAEYAHGQKLTVEWINGPIEATIIKDEAVDPGFGTGVMTITPWHSAVDFELAEKHGLDKEQVIDWYGKLLPIAGEFAGMKIGEARDKIIEKLSEKGLVDRIEDYTHNVSTAERTGGVIEPQIKLQWFVDTEKEFALDHSEIPGIAAGVPITLKKLLRTAVESSAISIVPEHFNKTYFHWIDNLRPWCISRQIWYGHRVPVWYRGEEIAVGFLPPGEGWTQDEDTLDTWFSSGSWTFSTLGWPEATKDLAKFHPTDVLETAYEILFFWVARMILMSGFALGQVPFRTVYLHGIIRDAQGRKFSKSLGNGIDPIEVVGKFGADAARMALLVGNTPGTDSRMSEDKIKGYKHFGNKLWNITRFILENTDESDPNAPLTDTDRALRDELDALAADITADLDAYRLYLASEKIYHYIWHRLADVLLEESKVIFAGEDETAKASRRVLLVSLLRSVLILLHPFMPFVTEEIWQNLEDTEGFLMVAPWPVPASPAA
ncbi:MAG TPA: valine--tRNA ligase [Candidatus Paceibacterota bacterium]|nr:valine--tRNA ligase [Candidatus Paceibacterota bacterium]